uniref:Uncharacterized protein n=1 Tax=Aegilops tauschii TaxID=37682 RepID=M8BNU9_AEGTA
MAKRSRKKKEQPAESLPDDLLLEVLARVPYRSLCRFKCVSKQWLALCSDPGLWKRSPQALSGFFCYARDDRKHELRFHNLSGRAQPLVDPGLPFLRGAWDGGVQTVDCCGGLLLCQCWKRSSRAGSAGMEYVVCNPATKEWTVVPATKQLHPNKKNIVRLGFDPLVPSRFAVFVLVRGHGVTRVEIFSSETGRWISKESEWGDGTSVDDHNCSASVFFGGALHLSTHDSSVITSQGRMYAMHMDYCNGKCQLSVWVLEDYASGQWTLKHTADMSGMIGHDEVCTFVAVNMERKSIFFQTNGWNEKLVSYHMENQRCRVIFSFERDFNLRCEPYIPSYTEWLSDGLLKAAP